MRLRLLFAAVVSCFLIQRVLSEELSSSSTTLWFGVLGDWGADPTDTNAMYAQQVVAKAMGSQLLQLKEPVQFILAPGDNFYPAGVPSDMAAAHQRLNFSFSQFYPDTPPFDVPWFFNVGNHDYNGWIDSQVGMNFSKFERRWVLPERFYVHSFNPAPSETHNDDRPIMDLFVVDTNTAGEYDGDKNMAQNMVGQNFTLQMEWLDARLAASRADWCLVMGHHTIYVANSASNIVQLQSTLSPLLQKYGCVYISGHEHDVEHDVFDNVHYVVSGGGCQTSIPATPQPVPVLPANVTISSYNKFVDVEASYSVFRVSRTEMQFQHFNYRNQLVYDYTIHNNSTKNRRV